MNITNEGRSKGAKKAKKNRDLIPKGGIADPKKANAEFCRRIEEQGKCFCNRVCKCGKRRAVTTVVTDFKQMQTRYISHFEYDEYVAKGWDINLDLGHHSIHALLATRVIK
tara:strand:- start:395 stop:727 length:333 start_codon:yes stop_codon:yes gene_type:complete